MLKLLLQVLIIHLALTKKTAENLKDYFDGEVIIVPPVEDEKGKISSTRIRQAILDGNVKEAGELLGAPLHQEVWWFMAMLVVVRLVIQQLIWCF